MRSWILFLLVGACRPDVPAHLTAIPLPDGRPGIGFDDLFFSAELTKVVVPGGRSGHVDLIDPATRAVTSVDGFSSGVLWVGGHDEGPTSAAVGSGVLYVTDRSTQELFVIDTARQKLGSVSLGASPDYVRYVSTTAEVWVTEPAAERIEVFSVADPRAPQKLMDLAVPGGPESLVIDLARSRAYTFWWAGLVVVIDLFTHENLAGWPNGCVSSRGLALDAQLGRLFAACDEGRVVALDVEHDGAELGRVEVPSGVDVIGFSSFLNHLYVPSADTGTLEVLAISDGGAPRHRRTLDAVPGVHCATADDRGHAYLCDSVNGQLLVYEDEP